MNADLQLLSQSLSLVEERMGYVFQDKQLLFLAFVHRSFYNEHRNEVFAYNERLEFLGDAVLGTLIAEYLYAKLPSHSEGYLSHVKSYLVEASMCAKFIQKLSLSDFLLLGRGEKLNEGRKKESIQADLFEALLAAIFLDGGFSPVKAFFWSHFIEEVEAHLKDPLRNWKAELQEYSQKKHQKPPTYQVLREEGPEHSKSFYVAVYLEGIERGRGEGPSKKEAEQQAAKEAWMFLEGNRE